MANNAIQIVIQATDKATGPIKQVGTSLVKLEHQAKFSYQKWDGMFANMKFPHAEAEKFSSKLGNIRDKLALLGKVTIFGLALREFAQFNAMLVRTADNYTLMQNRLRLVTTGTENLVRVQTELFNVSQSTRTEMLPLVELYSRVARSSQHLGATQKQLIAFTRGVSQAIQVSGATANEAAFGVIQLGQALASGVLRGDELRSVMEQMPRLSQAIAEGMGITVGELRKLGAEGALTAEQVFNAILTQLPKLNAEFSRTQATVASAWTTVTNSFEDMIGKINTATQTTSGFADLLLMLSRLLDQYITPAFERFWFGLARHSGAALVTIHKFIEAVINLMLAAGNQLPLLLFEPLIAFVSRFSSTAGAALEKALGADILRGNVAAELEQFKESVRAIGTTWKEVYADFADQDKRIAERIKLLREGMTLEQIGLLNPPEEIKQQNAAKAFAETQSDLRTELEKTREKVGALTKSIVAMYGMTDEQLKKLGYTRGDIDNAMNRVREMWDEAVEASKKGSKKVKDIFENIFVTARPVVGAPFAALWDEINERSMTEMERWEMRLRQFKERLEALVRSSDPAKKITQEQADVLLERFKDLELKDPIKITAKRIELPPPEDLMKPFRERMAQNLQDAFAEAFMNIGNGWKSTVQLFLDGFKRILAEAAAMNLARAIGLDKAAAGQGPLGKLFGKIFPVMSSAGAPVGGAAGGNAPRGGGDCAQKCATDVVRSVSETMGDSVSGTLKTFGTGLLGTIRTLTGGLWKFITSTLSKIWEFIKSAIAAIRAMASSSSGGSGGGWFSTAVAAIGSFFGGSAGGGRIPAGRPRIVNEEGQEIIVPDTPSRVYNARQMAFAGAGNAMGNFTFSPQYHVTINGGGNADETLARFAAYAERKDQRMKAEIIEMLRRNGFGRMGR